MANTWPVGAVALAAAVALTFAGSAQGRQALGSDPAASARYGAVATAVISPDDAWFVGHQKVPGQPRGTLAEHWDGSAWSTAPTPDFGDKYNDLTAVSAESASDVWAVGVYRSQGSQDRALAEHWDGAGWTSTPMPQPPGNVRVALTGVVAIALDDAWVVGETEGHGLAPIIDHWDGQSWTAVGGFPAGMVLSGVDATSASDVWVVGSTTSHETYTAHWDGVSWTTVSVPDPPAGTFAPTAVAVIGPGDVWCVGAVYNGTRLPAILHWDGQDWTRVAPGALKTTAAGLLSVSGTASDDVWAVGATYPRGVVERTLIEHWDGTSWQVVHSPSPLDRSSLSSVSADLPNDAWAIGNDNFWHVIALHWDGHRWRTS